MIEADRGIDLWSISADAVVITTNGDVNSSGRAVMGRGCAREATLRIEDIEVKLADALRVGGNRVHWFAQVRDVIDDRRFDLITFPVKHRWHEHADLELIERSTRELVRIVDRSGYQTVVLPRPGCGNGKLQWKAVRSFIEDLLDDRFVVVHK